MKKTLLIGKLDDAAKEIGDCLSEKCQVLLCSEDEDIIRGMVETEKPDLIVTYFSGSAVFARDMFTLLMPFKIPLLGIGDASNEAELFINGYLSESWIRFLGKPAAPKDILRCVGELFGEKPVGSGSGDSVGAETNGIHTNKKILLVDDSPAFVRAMQAVLSTRYHVTFATSGAQAIAAIAKSKPDLILLDYEMPVCDGKMTLQMLRAEEDMKDIPVIFLTGISDARHVSDVIGLHPQGYLLKPCSDEMIFSAIEKVLSAS